ncbi:MAG: hypothetical protein N3D82_04595 [Ignisphaera sp.]|nr:hypothetical protein [Ignisphaera sp.]MCX8168288.1 hypothetical protein [Ignisphaera sp.]MDW8085892.1 hypothetical protein [Ignisphaera sp.]
MSYSIGSVVQRLVERLQRRVEYTLIFSKGLYSLLVSKIIVVHSFIAREDVIVRSLKSIALYILRLQCVLEDALSATSILFELFASISIILIVVLVWH